MTGNYIGGDPTKDRQSEQSDCDKMTFLCSAEKEAKEKSDESGNDENAKVVKNDLFHGIPSNLSMLFNKRNGDPALSEVPDRREVCFLAYSLLDWSHCFNMEIVNILWYTDGKREVIRLVEMVHKKRILRIYEALQEKGYNPVGQIVGYILTEDPTYITNYNGARNLASRIDREELLKDIVLDYFNDEN